MEKGFDSLIYCNKSIYKSIDAYFLFVGMIPELITFFTFYVKAKKMEANACIKFPSQNKTKVSEDIRLPDETINGVLCEIHQVTHL